MGIIAILIRLAMVIMSNCSFLIFYHCDDGVDDDCYYYHHNLIEVPQALEHSSVLAVKPCILRATKPSV